MAEEETTQQIVDKAQATEAYADSVANATSKEQDYNRVATETARTNRDVSSSFNVISTFVSDSREKLENFEKTLETVGLQLDKTTTLSRSQIAAFGAIEVATLGASKAYDNLAGVSTANLNTFTSQINALGDGLTSSPLFHYGEILARQSGKTGSGIFNFAKEFVTNFAQSADQVVKLENAVFQLSARTGALGDVQKTAGPNLRNVNAIVEQQNRIIQQSANYFQISSAEVANFYTQLGSVKGAVDANVTTTGRLGGTVSGLTGAMLLAKGSGREFSAVVDDMKKALDNYNITGEEALLFTSRMTELSNKFNIQIEDVRSGLINVSNNFGIFGKEAEGAARLYNNYLGALQSTGISGHLAVGVIGGMTEGIKSLSIAQKAFLSAQTGGPGGLLGGFQIEKELREGKIDQVFDRVRQTLGKQFGKIVSLEEASQSQAAAQQLEKQILLLQQGPLGKFVQDPQSAMRVLEGFRAKDEGRSVEGLNKDFLQKTMETGDDVTKQTNTILGGMARTLEQIRDQSSFANLGTVQNLFTAGSGEGLNSPDTEATRLLRSSLADDMRKAAEESGSAASNARRTMENGVVTAERDTRSADVGKSLSGLTAIPGNLKLGTESTISGFGALFSNMSKENADKQKSQFLSEINTAKEKAQRDIQDPKELISVLSSFTDKENFLNTAFSKALAGANAPSAGQATGEALPANDLTRPANRLGAEARAVANRATPPVAPNADLATTAPRRQTTADGGNLGEITVHVEGYCVRCKSDMEAKSQSHAVNPVNKLP